MTSSCNFEINLTYRSVHGWACAGQEKGIKTSEAFLFETAEMSQRRQDAQEKKERNKAAFGWDVFNQDSLFKAYEKRISKLPKQQGGQPSSAEEDQSVVNYGSAAKPSDSALERLSTELKERQEGEGGSQLSQKDQKPSCAQWVRAMTGCGGLSC